MSAEKEKALIEFLYEQGEALLDFLKKNDYTGEYNQISLYVMPDLDYEGVTKYDYLSASLTQWYDNGDPKRTVTKTSNLYNEAPTQTEYIFKENGVRHE